MSGKLAPLFNLENLNGLKSHANIINYDAIQSNGLNSSQPAPQELTAVLTVSTSDP